jgi:hypothetical protein
MKSYPWSAANWRNASFVDWSESRLVRTPGSRCRATSRFAGTKLWIRSWRRGHLLAITVSMTLLA